MPVVPKFIFSTYGPYLLWKFRQACKSPRESQRGLLNHIIEKNRDTAFGRKHRFAEICDFSDFQSQVPLAEYEALEPYVRAAMRGEEKQLTAEKPILYGMTSGTTGSAKYIPVTPESRELKARLMKLWLAGLFRDHPDIFDGRVLAFVSPEDESQAEDGTPCGAESGHGYRNIPKPIKKLYSAPYEIFTVKEYHAKYYLLLRLAAEHSLSMLYTCNPSTVLLLAELMDEYRETIIHDIRDGRACSDSELCGNVPPEILKLVNARCRPNPERAAELEQAVQDGGGALRPREVWPRLSVVGCWKGGTVEMYLRKISTLYPKHTSFRDIGYFATELRGSVPLSDESSDGVLAIETNFYEFAPLEDEDPAPDSLLEAGDLEVGRQYVPYITNTSGLYRYNMNDILEVTGFYGKTPCVRFMHKAKGVVSFTGEKLSEAHVLQSVKEAFGDYQGEYHFLSAVGVSRDTEVPYYSFLVEFKAAPGKQELQKFIGSLETQLREHNVEYAAKRDSMRLGEPRLKVVQPGEYRKYQQHEVGRGRSDAQFKILRLTDDQEFADAFECIEEVTLAGNKPLQQARA